MTPPGLDAAAGRGASKREAEDARALAAAKRQHEQIYLATLDAIDRHRRATGAPPSPSELVRQVRVDLSRDALTRLIEAHRDAHPSADAKGSYSIEYELPRCRGCGGAAARCPCDHRLTAPAAPWPAYVAPALSPAQAAQWEAFNADFARLMSQCRSDHAMRELTRSAERAAAIEAELEAVAAPPPNDNGAPAPVLAVVPAAVAVAAAVRPDLVWIDTETTGLSTAHHQVIELAAVLTDPDGIEVKKRAVMKIRLLPGVQVDPGAVATHGLDPRSAAFVKAAHPMPEVLARFAEWLPERCQFAGHNVSFDRRHIEASFARCGLPGLSAFDLPTLDTMPLARRALLKTGRVGDVKLATLCSHFGLSNEGAHRALADVERTIAVYRALRPLVEQLDADEAAAKAARATKGAKPTPTAAPPVATKPSRTKQPAVAAGQGALFG